MMTSPKRYSWIFCLKNLRFCLRFCLNSFLLFLIFSITTNRYRIDVYEKTLRWSKNMNLDSICCQWNILREKWFFIIITIKACVRYFFSIFFFTKWYPFNNYVKCFLFHLKSSFHSQHIQIFVVFSFLYTLSRYRRTNGSGIIYDAMNWLA